MWLGWALVQPHVRKEKQYRERGDGNLQPHPQLPIYTTSAAQNNPKRLSPMHVFYWLAITQLLYLLTIPFRCFNYFTTTILTNCYRLTTTGHPIT